MSFNTLEAEFFGGPRSYEEEPEPGQCYCHLTMHSSHEGHEQRPCHFCEEEVRNEWPEMFDIEPIEISPSHILELLKLEDAWEALNQRKVN